MSMSNAGNSKLRMMQDPLYWEKNQNDKNEDAFEDFTS